MMAMTWLSVILPVYNGERYLPKTFERIAAQERINDIEILVIDDGSTDESVKLIQQWSQRLPIRLIAGPARGNWVAATNIGLREARGQFVSFLHQDDYWEVDRLRVLRELTTAHSSAVVFSHAVNYVNRTDRIVGSLRGPFPEDLCEVSSSEFISRLIVQNFVSIPAPIFRRAAGQACGEMDEELWYTADWDYWLRLARHGSTVWLNRRLASFRVHAASQTIQRSDTNQGFRNQLEIVAQRHVDFVPAALRKRSLVASRFSNEVNCALAAGKHGSRVAWLKLMRAAWNLSPTGWWWYWQNSRLGERLWARIGLR